MLCSVTGQARWLSDSGALALAQTGASAGLAAGIFHRKEVAISEVKEEMHKSGIPTRL